MEVAEKSYYDSLDRNCYMHITLTDEEDIPDAVRKLQVIYPNLMKLDYDNQRTRGRKSFADVQEVEEKHRLIYLKIYMKNRIIRK